MREAPPAAATAGHALLGRAVLVTLSLVAAFALALPESTLFELDWDNRAIFEGDLRQPWLDDALELEQAPVHHLHWNLVTPTRLEARLELRLVNDAAAPWNELYFHLLANLLGGRMVIEGVTLDGRAATFRVEDDRLLAVSLPLPLEPGMAAVVGIDYRLDVPTRSGSNYGILSYRREMLSLAHAYPVLAVVGERGWDLDDAPRYGDLLHARAGFFVASIDAPAWLDLVANGRLQGGTFGEERQSLVVVAGPVRDFYIAGGVRLQAIELERAGVLIRGHAPAGMEEGMQRAVEYAATAIDLFGSIYGPYPHQELEIVAISTSALGMEFPGAVALRRELLEPDEGELLESTVVHEVAHQWFYGLVGNDQVSEPWLDEALTQYLTMRYFLARHGAKGYKEFRDRLISRWEHTGRQGRPVGGPVSSYDASDYGALVYGLGPLVVEWLAGLMERRRFDAFLREYVERNAFGLARAEEFRRSAAAYCQCDLEPFFERWIWPGR